MIASVKTIARTARPRGTFRKILKKTDGKMITEKFMKTIYK
jgi:hypothetical protein